MKLAVFSLVTVACMAAAQAQTVNPTVTQANITETICVPNWTRSVRPTTSYTNKYKKQFMQAQNLDWSVRKQYELDHIVPLAVGGAPKDPKNFLLQPVKEATAKDAMEVKYHKLVCSGKIGLKAAQACFLNDWKSCR
jgi:hypothetical protein